MRLSTLSFASTPVGGGSAPAGGGGGAKRAVSLLMASSASASLPPPSGELTKLTELDLSHTQVSDAGCATLAIAIGSGALPAAVRAVRHRISIDLAGTPASTAAKAAVQEALSSVSTTE